MEEERRGGKGKRNESTACFTVPVPDIKQNNVFPNKNKYYVQVSNLLKKDAETASRRHIRDKEKGVGRHKSISKILVKSRGVCQTAVCIRQKPRVWGR